MSVFLIFPLTIYLEKYKKDINGEYFMLINYFRSMNSIHFLYFCLICLKTAVKYHFVIFVLIVSMLFLLRNTIINVLFLIFEISYGCVFKNQEKTLICKWKYILFVSQMLQLIKSKKELNTESKRNNTTFGLSLFLEMIVLLFIIITLGCSHKPREKIQTKLCGKNFQCSSGIRCENENIDQGRSYLDILLDISNCFFSRSSLYTGSGGVIYVSGGSYSMNVNKSMFYNCVCSENGGAIHFNSPYSYISMICAHKCSASWYHFAYLYTSQVNQVEFLSISNCSHTIFGYYSIRLRSGNQKFDSTNSSMNNADQNSGVGIFSPSAYSSTYCTFSNNKVSHSICLNFYSDSNAVLMIYSNIVHNNSPYGNGIVFIEGAGPKKIMNCIFKDNHNFLFCVSEGALEVLHSFIDHSSLSLSSRTEVATVTNNSFISRITYQIHFFNTLHCNTDISQTEQKQYNTIDQKHTNRFSFIFPIVVITIS